MSVRDVAAMLNLGEQTVRDYRNRFLLQRMASLAYKRPPRPPPQADQNTAPRVFGSIPPPIFWRLKRAVTLYRLCQDQPATPLQPDLTRI